MAKRELLVEYEKEMLDELLSVGKLLGRNIQSIDIIKQALGITEIGGMTINNGIDKIPKKGIIKGEGIPRGDSTWEAYVQIILRELGGKAKTKEVVEYAIKANPKVPAEMILSAIRGKLSILFREKTIGANVSTIRSEGYEFYLLDGEKKNNP